MKTMLLLTIMGMLLPMAGSSAPWAPAAVSNPAFVQRCEREMLPRFDIEWRLFGFDTNNTVSSKVLHNKSVHGSLGEFMLGMTATQTRAEIAVSAPSLTDSDSGQECLAPRIFVELLLPRMDVYVARELPASSCSYRAVLDHEMQHIRVYEEAVPKLAETLRARLKTRYGNGPLFAPAGKGLDQLDNDIEHWLRPMIQAELMRVEQVQRTIDSAEESFRLSGVCGGELNANLGRRY